MSPGVVDKVLDAGYQHCCCTAICPPKVLVEYVSSALNLCFLATTGNKFRREYSPLGLSQLFPGGSFLETVRIKAFKRMFHSAHKPFEAGSAWALAPDIPTGPGVAATQKRQCPTYDAPGVSSDAEQCQETFAAYSLSRTVMRTSVPLHRISGTYIAWPITGNAWNTPGTSARKSYRISQTPSGSLSMNNATLRSRSS